MPVLAVIEAPSNLGLRPPQDGVAPGVSKLAGALRDTGLVARLEAIDRGVVVAPRYHASWDGVRVRNQGAIGRYTRKLAARIEEALVACERAVVLGGDCSILLGAGLALRRRGRYGLLFVDGHSDFRHPGNTEAMRSAAGEDLALVTGRGATELTDIDGLCPYFDDADVAVLGVRSADPYLPEVQGLGMEVVDAVSLRTQTPERVAENVLARLAGRDVDGFWVHVDADVVDPSVFSAVDSPVCGGIALDELGSLLAVCSRSVQMVGLDVTILDPDLDEEGVQVDALSRLLESGLLP
jgi:arginase